MRAESEGDGEAPGGVNWLSAASGTETTRAPWYTIQWALGTAGSGAHIHFHNAAWNQLFYGKKHWYLFPPGRNLMGKKQVLDWVENDLPGLEVQGFKPFECHQQPGDVLIVPELWGHAVLNTQDALAVASEFRGSTFRYCHLRPRSLCRSSRDGMPPSGSPSRTLT